MSREVSLHWKRYLLFLISFVSLFSLFIIFTLVNRPLVADEFSLYCLYLVGLYVFGYAVADRSFKDMHSKKTGLTFMLLPASVVKKFLSVVLVNSLGFAIVYSFLFLLMKWVVKSWLSDASFHSEYIVLFTSQVSFVVNALLLFLPVQALVYYGSISFKKYSFGKTLLSLSLFFLSVIAFRYFVFDFMLDGGGCKWVLCLIAIVIYLVTFNKFKVKQVS